MVDQSTPVIDAIQDRHVEKIILSGAPFISSILGPRAYGVTPDAAPFFYRDPIISGLVIAPSLLFCEAESFGSSPRAVITYQWKRDTVDISGETNQTYNSILADIGVSITCNVTVTNGSGADVEISNAIVIEGITASDLFELDVYTIQGLNSVRRQDMTDAQIFIISGMLHADKADINEFEAYGVTGMQGLNNITTIELESYVTQLPVFVANLPVVNGNAENSDMSDWTMDDGNIQSLTTAPSGHPQDIALYRQGSRFFKADDNGNGVDATMSQSIAIAGANESLVDLGRCVVIANFIHQSKTGTDWLEITMSALDTDEDELASATTVVPFNPEGSFNNDRGWRRETTFQEMLILPTLTRFVKISVLFSNAGSGSQNNVYADDFTVDLFEIE